MNLEGKLLREAEEDECAASLMKAHTPTEAGRLIPNQTVWNAPCQISIDSQWVLSCDGPGPEGQLSVDVGKFI